MAAPGSASGIARVDARTKRLLSRLHPGEIAIIDHEDLDRVSAEGLISRQVGAVVNASRSSTGRYPNLGPLLLRTAGIPLLDEAGPAVMQLIEGTRVHLDGSKLLSELDGKVAEVSSGRLLDLEDVEEQLDAAKRGIAAEIERFAENTIEYVRNERDVLVEAARLPEVKADFHGRHVLIVVRGQDYKNDLAALRSYVREVRPVLFGVVGGADALLEFGFKPDIIIGDMDSVTTKGLLSGAELVVHAYAGGKAPGLERLEALELDSVVFEATGTSEDIAMLLAYERGAELIVAVGTHANLIEFMDKGRKGMASTFLTRLRVGTILVDAKGVSRLYRSSVKRSDLALLLLVALVTLAASVALSEPLRLYVGLIWIEITQVWFSLLRSLPG
ncbi:MAG: putative cytokinetic ring protein SteA [Actinomycetota bacterium]|nr:putative cytokinetic ring protein SteA [Actinomycetota bacterium]